MIRVREGTGNPLTLSQGRALFNLLISLLTPEEQYQRKSAIIKASQWMTEVSNHGGSGPPGKSFLEIESTQKKGEIKSPCDTRIDIEILSGTAFIKDSL